MANTKKRCSICGRWYRPDPRTRGHQVSCGQASCRKERKRRANKSWQIRHPGYDTSRQAKKRDWAQAYPDYWRQYREKHPAYAARDNKRRRERWERAQNAANQDAIAKISVEQLASIPRYEPPTAANQDMMDRRVDMVVDCLLGVVRAANQDSISASSRSMP